MICRAPILVWSYPPLGAVASLHSDSFCVAWFLNRRGSLTLRLQFLLSAPAVCSPQVHLFLDCLDRGDGAADFATLKLDNRGTCKKVVLSCV